jgi:hypothetical protein
MNMHVKIVCTYVMGEGGGGEVQNKFKTFNFIKKFGIGESRIDYLE